MSASPSSPRLDASVLHFHDAPHPRFWLPSGQLRAVVRARLRKIAQAYLAYLNLPAGVKVRDITFTGSLTGRNYTDHSDVDVHLLLDYDKVGKPELVGDFFDLKRKEWADTRPITVYGYPVELYAQDFHQFQADPAGHYSLEKDKWVHPVPEPENGEVDDERALQLAREYAVEAKAILARKDGQLPAIKAFIGRFKTLRQRGLTSKAGLYSPENLAFKILRNTGSLDKLWDVQSTLEAQALTLTESILPLPTSPMSTPVILIKESQLPVLREALRLQKTFLAECAEMGALLTEGELLEESVISSITEKFRKLLDGGGAPLLRKTVLAAVMGGSLLLSSEAIAKAAAEAGLDQAQVTQLQQQVAAAAPQGATATPQTAQYAQALQQLEKRFVVDNADPAHRKQYMKFTGNLAEVVGIGTNGYPIFAPGSASQQAFDAAFATPKIITGTVNAPDKNGVLKNFAGRFVEASGLFYVYTPNLAATASTPPAPAAAPAPAAPTPAPANAPSAQGGGYLYDFSGLMEQAKARYGFKKRANGQAVDNIGGQTKAYSSFLDYAYDFVRQSGTGLESYTNAQIDQLFAGGLKVRVPKLPAGQRSV